VLGAGRAGRGLAHAFRAGGVEVLGVHGRRPAVDGVFSITAGPLPPAIGQATVVLVAVRDGQLPSALDEVAAAPLRPGAVVLHASGSAEPRAAMRRLADLGHPTGTFHPLVPLADPARAPALVRGAWIGIDGDPAALEAGRALARCVGAHVLAIPPAGRAAYHAAAVMASNFPTVLAALAAQLMEQAGVDPADAREAVRHLMLAAVANLAHAAAGDSLTGPVSRGDADTVARHLGALASNPELDLVYRALSRAALPIAAAQGADAGALERIRSLAAITPPRR